MKKSFVTSILLLLVSFAYAQETTVEDEEVNEIIDNLLGEEDVLDDLVKSVANFQFLYFSANFSNKTYFSGRDIGIDQFNITPQIMYMNSKGFFAGISGLYYSEFVPRWDYTSLTLGYGKNFGTNNKYRWSTSYTRYLYSEGVDNPFENSLMGSISLSNTKKTLITQLSATLLFGDETSYQFTSTTYGTIDLFKKGTQQLKLQPQLAILVGKQTIELARTITIRNQQITVYDQQDEFGLINAQLNLPIQYSIDAFDFELGYIINFPSALGSETNLKTTSTLTLSLAYMLDLN